MRKENTRRSQQTSNKDKQTVLQPRPSPPVCFASHPYAHSQFPYGFSFSARDWGRGGGRHEHESTLFLHKLPQALSMWAPAWLCYAPGLPPPSLESQVVCTFFHSHSHGLSVGPWAFSPVHTLSCLRSTPEQQTDTLEFCQQGRSPEKPPGPAPYLDQ